MRVIGMKMESIQVSYVFALEKYIDSACLVVRHLLKVGVHRRTNDEIVSAISIEVPGSDGVTLQNNVVIEMSGVAFLRSFDSII